MPEPRLEANPSTDEQQQHAETIFRELLGNLSDRLAPHRQDQLGLSDTIRYWDSQGHPINNLLGEETALVGLRRNQAGEIELTLYANGAAARDGQPALRMKVSYEDGQGTTTETRQVFDFTAVRQTEQSATIRTTVDRSTGDLTIAASNSGGELQTLRLAADGRPLALEVVSGGSNGDSRRMNFNFSADGQITSVSINGNRLSAEQARPFIDAAREMIRTVARENNLPVPRFPNAPAPDGQPAVSERAERLPEGLRRFASSGLLKPMDPSLLSGRPRDGAGAAPTAKPADLPADTALPVDDSESPDEFMPVSFEDGEEGDEPPADKPAQAGPEQRRQEVLESLRRQIPDGETRRAFERVLNSPQGGPELVAAILRIPESMRNESGLTRAVEQSTTGRLNDFRDQYRRADALQRIDSQFPAESREPLRRLTSTTEGLGLAQRIVGLPQDILNGSRIGEVLRAGAQPDMAMLRDSIRQAEQRVLERRTAALPAIPPLDQILTPEQLERVRTVRDYQDHLQRNFPVTPFTPEQVQARVDAYLRGEGHAAASLPPDGRPVRTDRVIHIVMGLPGAGKTTALTDPLRDRYSARMIDSDMIKPDLPGYRGGFGNQLLHTTSGQVADAVLAASMSRGENLVYSTIGRTPDSVYQTIEQARAAGYRVAVHFADVAPAESARRIYARAYTGSIDPAAPGAEPRQFIPPAYSLTEAGHRPRAVFEMLTSPPGLVDAWQHIDTNAQTTVVGESNMAALADHVPPPVRAAASDTVARGPGDPPADKPAESKPEEAAARPKSAAEIDLLRDFRQAGGPTSEQGRALLRMLNPTGTQTAEQVLQAMTRELGTQRAEQLLERAATAVASGGMTSEQTQVFRRLLNLPASNYYTALERAGDVAIANAARLVSGENPLVTSTNAEAVRNFLAPGGAEIATVLRNANAEALPHVMQLFTESRAGHADMTGAGWNSVRPGETGTGHRNQRFVYNGLMQAMQRPGAGGQPSLFDQGWRVVAGGNQSTADRAGVDFVMVNVRTGQWMPLDVTDHLKSVGGRPKVFYERINVRDMFNQHNGNLTDAAALEAWMRNYVNRMEPNAFDLAAVRPPSLAAETNPQRRREQLAQFEQQTGEALRNARDAERRAIDEGRPSEELERRRRALETLMDQHATWGRRFMEREQRLQENAVAVLRRHILERAQHYANNNTASGTPVPTLNDSQGAASQMVRVGPDGQVTGVELRQGDNIVLDPQLRGVERSTLHVGSMRELVNQAIDQLPADIREQVRNNLSQYRFGEGGAPLSPQEQAILREFTEGLRHGLATPGGEHAWTELSTIVGRQQGAERRAAVDRTGLEPIVSPENLARYIDTLNREVYERRMFRLDARGNLTFDARAGELSIADLTQRYQETLQQLQEARQRGENTADLDREIARRRGHLQDALNPNSAAPPEWQALRQGPLEALRPSIDGITRPGETATISDAAARAIETVLGPRTEIQIDRVGEVQPGRPRISYTDGSGVPITIRSYDPARNEFIVERNGQQNQRVAAGNLRATVTISGAVDPSTLARELGIARAQAITDLSRPMRGVQGMTAEQMTQLDNRSMEQTRGAAYEPANAGRQTMQDAAESVRVAWETLYGGPLPDLNTAEGRQQLREVVEIARSDLHDAMRAETDASRRSQLQQARDILAQYHRELGLPEGQPRPVFDMMNRLTSTGDLLFLRSTRLTPAEAARARESLARFGPNALGDAATMQRYLQGMLAGTRDWNQDLRRDQDRREQLAREVSQSEATIRALATAEARQRLGATADPAAVQQLAERLISGQERATVNGALDLARQRHESMRNEHAAISQRIVEQTNARATRLQQGLNEFCRANGLPPLRITLGENLGGAQGVYRRGSGEIVIPRAELLDRPGGVQAVSAIYHELVHAQQDQLIVRMLADRAAPPINGVRASEEALRRMQEAYRAATGGELTRELLDSVLRLRREGSTTPQRLTPEQTLRAEQLAEAFRTSAPAIRERETLSNDLRIAQTERSRLSGAEANGASQNLLRALNEPGGERLGERLFGTADRAAWPEPVRQLLEQWRTAPKDASGRAQQWNEQAARETLQLALDGRVSQLTGQLRESYRQYRNGVHEQEAHLYGGDLETLARRELVDALIASGRQPGRELERAIPASEAARLRDIARDAGMPFAGDAGMRNLTNLITDQMRTWRDDVTSQWESGAGRRAAIQEAYDRALDLARRHAAGRGLIGSALEQEARRLVDTPSPEIATDRAFTEAREQYLQRRGEYFREFAAVHEVLLQRQQQLQTAVDRYTEANGLPRVRLDFRGTSNAGAGYDRGAGTITLSNADLVGRGRAPNLMASITGQLAVAHQDAQIVRSLIDRLNGTVDRAPAPGTQLSTEQIRSVQDAYLRATGARLDAAFLDQVARGRREVMTAPQIERADALARSFNETRQLLLDYERRAQDLRTAERELQLLRSSAPRSATELVARLAEPGGDALARRLFGASIADLPADHPAKRLVARYREAAVGGLQPAAESAQWSEREARTLLSQSLETRTNSLIEQQGRAQADYMQRAHARESAVVGGEAYNHAAGGQQELMQPRAGDGTNADLHQAQQRVEARQFEQRFLDTVKARLREMHPGIAFGDLTPHQIDAAMQLVIRDLNAAAGQPDVTLFGERIPAAEATARARVGEQLRLEFVRGTAPGASEPAALATRDRVRQYIEPPRVETGPRDLSMPFDPWPSERDLARLGEGRVILERTETGVRLRREGTTEEWSSDRMPTDEEIRRHVRERVQQLREEIARRERANEPVRPEERALLESLTRMETALNDPRAMEGVRGNLRPAFGRTRAVIGSGIGIGIIISSALAWYIRAHENGQRPPALQSLDLPGV